MGCFEQDTEAETDPLMLVFQRVLVPTETAWPCSCGIPCAAQPLVFAAWLRNSRAFVPSLTSLP